MLMNNCPVKAFFAFLLLFNFDAVHSEPVEHTFSTTGTVFVDPLLTGLTSVSGSFTYDNGADLFGTVGPGGGLAGAAVYRALSGLSGNANGNLFSDSLGSVIVGDDKILDPATFDRDEFLLNWRGLGDGTLGGFTFNGMPLVTVRITWTEGRDGIGDFLDDQSLPSVLPPATPGQLLLVFEDEVGAFHVARFGVNVDPIIPADSNISFNGTLVNIDFDDGGAVYSGVPVGTNFFGSINRLTSEGFISDGTTLTQFDPGDGLEVENDVILDAEDAAFLNALSSTNFVAGDLVDVISIEGSSQPAGRGLLVFGLIYVLDPDAFDNDSRNNYPPDPNDILIPIFFVDEEDNEEGPDIFASSGIFTSDADDDGIEDAIDGTLNGVFNDQSTVFSNDFTDQHLGGLTFGSIIARSGDIVTVADLPAEGVILSGNGAAGGLPQLVRACTDPVVDIFLNDGDTIIATCGSFLGETLAGPVTVTVGMNIDVTIPAGAIAFIEELPGSILSISHLGESGTPDIVIDDKGAVTTLGSDDSPLVTILDSDDDGVPDTDDMCPATVIPESVPTNKLKPNHWALTDGDMLFDTVTRGMGNGPGRGYSTSDTAGCSCEQIIEAQGLGDGHTKHGCSISAMDDWVKLVNR
jgi:hypothetical protein